MRFRIIPHITVILVSLALSTGCQSSARRVGGLEPPGETNPGVEAGLTIDDSEKIIPVQSLKENQTGNVAEQTAETNRWTRWMERFRQPKRIPFPRTDLQHEPEKTELVDLQQQLGEF